MSKFKNISLINYNKNGYSLFFIIDENGKRDFFFDFFINSLLERRYTKNTIQLYSIAVANFLDYLNEAMKYTENQNISVDGYKLAEIISTFPIYLSSGINSSNEMIRIIASNLNAIPKSGSTEETYIAGVNKYLALSDDFQQRINDIKNECPDFVCISQEKLFPSINKKEKMSDREKFNINKNNMLSSVMSGGATFKRISALKKTRRQSNQIENDNLKIFPIEHSISFIKNSKNHFEKTFFSLLATSGIRLSEALLLTLDDIDVNKREIYIKNPNNKSLNDYNNFFTYEEKQQLPFKSRSTIHTFLIKPFEDYFWENLLHYIKNERTPSNNHPFIFTNEDGSPLLFNDKKVTQRFKTLAKKITGHPYTPHSFRHMYISYLVNYIPVEDGRYGMPVHQVQKLVGHTNINSTQIYVHHDLDILRKKQKEYFDKLELSSGYNNIEAIKWMK